MIHTVPDITSRHTDKILAELILMWRKTHGGQRFGQWLYNTTRDDGEDGARDYHSKLFYLEDEELAKLITIGGN